MDIWQSIYMASLRSWLVMETTICILRLATHLNSAIFPSPASCPTRASHQRDERCDWRRGHGLKIWDAVGIQVWKAEADFPKNVFFMSIFSSQVYLKFKVMLSNLHNEPSKPWWKPWRRTPRAFDLPSVGPLSRYISIWFLLVSEPKDISDVLGIIYLSLTWSICIFLHVYFSVRIPNFHFRGHLLNLLLLYPQLQQMVKIASGFQTKLPMTNCENQKNKEFLKTLGLTLRLIYKKW